MPDSRYTGSSYHGAEPSSGFTVGTTAAARDSIRALSEADKSSLEAQIRRALSLDRETKEQIFHGDFSREQRRKLIESEIDRMGSGERIRYKMRRTVTGKNGEEAYVDFKLNQMKERVHDRRKGLVNFEQRVLLPGLAEELFDLYRKIYPLIPFFRSVWRTPYVFRHMIEYLLKKRIPDSKNDLSDFITFDEMQSIFRRTESRKELVEEVLRRIRQYLDGITEETLAGLAEGISPLYYLRDLALFDYGELFSRFQYDAVGDPRDVDPEFHQAAYANALDLLEQLYVGIHTASRIPRDVQVYREPIALYLSFQGKSVEDTGEEDASLLEMEPDVEEERIEGVVERLKEVTQVVESLQERILIPQIVKVLRGDPFYRFMVYLPKLRLREFYFAYLKLKCLSQLDERFNDVRMGMLGRMISEILPKPTKEFEFYRSTIQASVKKLGLPGFRYVKSLNVLYNFILQRFRGRMAETMRILTRILPARIHHSASDLTLHAANIEDVADRINDFDLSFSPESDEGKTFYRVRYSLEKDYSQQQQYKSIILQKDREARAILEKGMEHFSQVQEIFESIRKAKPAHLNERYAHFDGTSADDRPLDHLLEGYVNDLRTFRKVLNQVIIMEEGG
ncbi:MAG: DUF5312 family protein [Spirochaetaceae bacterium]